MAKLSVQSQKAKALLGSTVEISLYSEGNFESALGAAFHLASDLEKVFNANDPNSEISILNRSQGDDTTELSAAMGEVLEKVQEISELSEGAFGPDPSGNGSWDLTNISKAYIIDRMVASLLLDHPDLMGSIHIDRYFRFFNSAHEFVKLQIGNSGTPLLRELDEERESICSSEPGSVVMSTVIAKDCMTAEALTLVGLYAPAAIVEKCATRFDAEVFVFSTSGDTLEIFNPHENSTLDAHTDDWILGTGPV